MMPFPRHRLPAGRFPGLLVGKPEVAMFDEMDEGTAIFKLDSVPPSGGRNRFLAPPPPSDLYLRLAGEAAERLRRRTAAP